MPSIQLLAATVDELIKVTGTILHSGVLGRMLRNIGRKIAERAYYRYKLSAPQFSGGRMNEYVKAATSIPLWPSEPLDITSEQITFEVKECPFGLPPADNPQYCQITSGFFGGLATQHFGRARVEVIQGGDALPNTAVSMYGSAVSRILRRQAVNCSKRRSMTLANSPGHCWTSTYCNLSRSAN